MTHVPHDESDELHDDLVEAGEEVHHDLAALPHAADEDAERRAERDDACDTTNRSPLSSRFTSKVVSLSLSLSLSL